MKKKVKGLCLTVFLFMLFDPAVNAQIVSISGARTMIPGLYAGIGYSHPTFSDINLGARVFVESAMLNRINYRALGADVVAEYSNGRDPLDSKFAFKAAFGATAQIEKEPWIYQDWPINSRINYGVVAESGGLWNMTEAFALSLFAQQKFLFNKLLGSTHFLIGLSLSYRLGL